MEAVSLHPGDEFSGIASIRPDQRQRLEQAIFLGFLQYQLRSIPVLHVRRMNDQRQDVAHCIDQNVPLPPFHLLRSIIATKPLFSVVFTDWESMMPADGSGSLPALS